MNNEHNNIDLPNLNPNIGAKTSHTFTINDGVETLETRESLRVTSSSWVDDSTILGSARTADGSPARGNLTAQSVVKVGSMEMSLQGAVQLGLVTVDDRGNYSETTQTPPVETPIAPAETIPVFMTEQTEMAATLLASRLPAQTYDNVVNSMISTALGVDSQIKIGEITAAANIKNDLVGYDRTDLSNATVSAMIQDTVTGYQAASDAMVGSMGIDPQAFYADLRAKDPGGMRSAMLQIIHQNNMSQLRNLAIKYQAKVARTGTVTNQQVTRAGATIVPNNNGKDLISVRGIQMTREQARRSGLI